LALFFLYYNFCRVHSTIGTTPAIKAGIATEKWSVERLLGELATH
jgi:transposase InsO family protein